MYVSSSLETVDGKNGGILSVQYLFWNCKRRFDSVHGSVSDTHIIYYSLWFLLSAGFFVAQSSSSSVSGNMKSTNLNSEYGIADITKITKGTDHKRFK